jgi:hypothetical protein
MLELSLHIDAAVMVSITSPQWPLPAPLWFWLLLVERLF